MFVLLKITGMGSISDGRTKRDLVLSEIAIIALLTFHSDEAKLGPPVFVSPLSMLPS